MISFEQVLTRNEFAPIRAHFEGVLARRTDHKRHGDLASWQAIVKQLPSASPCYVDFSADAITVGLPSDINQATQAQIELGLHALSPWRKGPFQIFDTYIDTEWRSDWKWQRVKPHISDLSGRRVLDVGCGTGYHCWRMLGDGAAYVVGIDPSMRFLIQYQAIQKFAQDQRFDFLPIGIEDMPVDWPIFDSVFSMGVLYHRRNPINHLLELKNLMTDGGELILETLIVDECENGILTPPDRYAQMRNVWSIMTVDKILQLLGQAGFKEAKCVDQNVTSLAEQRRTDWMQFHSLEQFLDPADISKTIEGHPAPKRGVFIAHK